jgi:hypothetical protein
MQHPNVEPTSDEELQLMEDVEFLHSQLRTVGDPVDANFAKKIIRSIGDKSLGVRVRKWLHRKIHLEKSLQNANSRMDAKKF